MKTKFIKVSTADRLPEKEGIIVVIGRKGVLKTTELSRITNYETFHITYKYWLEEKPDYEEEMKEMLEELTTHHFNFMGCDEINELKSRAEELLTKLKTS